MLEALQKIWGWLPALLESTAITLELTAASVTTAIFLGVFLALGKLSKKRVIRSLSSAYVFFFRGTPLLLQLFFIYYTVQKMLQGVAVSITDNPGLQGWFWDGFANALNNSPLNNRFFAAYFAFSLNIAAYLAEIIRAAIQSIPKGQMEAARSLGLTYGQGMRLIVIPQAYRRMVPPVCNEFVMVLKDTSLVSIISLMDLTYQTRQISTLRESQLVYIPAMLIYLVLSAFFTIIFNKIEKKLAEHE
ncbi:MAG: amino acid ABC transporter permease [Oscillospiraceae bacterium]|jgi:polar amino acid transport system permease protein|nr:amino acid ABC transporter permease [Oscillospiraceae bacterium]